MSSNLIYEVECQLDPDIVADYDAWLPGHIRDVLACAGFQSATIEAPETQAGEPQRRMIRYRVEDIAALDHYLENDATRLRTETAERFGGRVQCVRRLLKPRHDLIPAALEPKRCLNCGAAITGNHCAQCGQSGDVHLLTVGEVAHDFVHSVLHLDGRIWHTLRMLVLRPGELTRDYIAGRRARSLPPFRIYLVISILFFALSATLPDSELLNVNAEGDTVFAPVRIVTPDGSAESPPPPGQAAEIDEEIKRKLAAAGVEAAALENVTASTGGCNTEFSDNPALDGIKRALNRACEQMRADGGARFAERFAATAPKLMFLFLPLMAAVALLFYWRPRRLYAEHLVLFLHVAAFLFLLLSLTALLNAVASLPAAIGRPARLPEFRALRCTCPTTSFAPCASFTATGARYGRRSSSSHCRPSTSCCSLPCGRRRMSCRSRSIADAGMNEHRAILHVDMDAFFASVEQLDNPGAGRQAGRGGRQPAAAAWWPPPATKRAVSASTPRCRCARRCDAARTPVVRPATHQALQARSRSRCSRSSASSRDLVEGLSLDEALSRRHRQLGLFGSAVDMAREIKHRIRKRTGLTASVGVAHNKLLAKLASEMDKPDGLTVIRPAGGRGHA